MIAALTLLPALLGFIGPRVLSRRQKSKPGQERSPHRRLRHQGFLAPLGRHRQATARSLPAVVALVLIVLIALPFFSLRLGSADQGNDPVGSTTRQAYDMLAKGFGPGFNGPLQLVAVVHGTADQAALARVVAEVTAQPDVASVAPLRCSSRPKTGAEVATVNVYPDSAPQDAATTNLVYHLRTQTMPGGRVGIGADRATWVGRPRSSSTSPTCSRPSSLCSSGWSSCCRSSCWPLVFRSSSSLWSRRP